MSLLTKDPDVATVASGLPRLNKRFIRILFLSVFSFTFIFFFYYGNEPNLVLPFQHFDGNLGQWRPFGAKTAFSPVTIDRPEDKTPADLCASFPAAMLQKVQPVLKMGHGEKRARIEAQLESCSACFRPSDLLIYSDLDENIRGYQVIDIIATLPSEYFDLKTNPHMHHYLEQKKLKDDGTLDEDLAATKSIDGWTIDKYKFLPMVEHAWKNKPGKDFYFFYETDTYVFWDNVFRFLDAFDPDVPLYMGSPTPGRVDESKGYRSHFANGGPGFVLSKGAIKAMLHRNVDPAGQFVEAPMTDRWLPLLRDDCCGDSVMGWTLYHVNVTLQGYWPLFNPHPLHSVPYSHRYWCQPVLTLHKTKPEDMLDLWRWEFSARQKKRPMLYSDLWSFRHPGKPATLEDWDNGNWDGREPSPEDEVDTLEKCAKYCESLDECVQYSWHGRDAKKCIAMTSIRYGEARKPDVMGWTFGFGSKNGALGLASDLFQKAASPGQKWSNYTAGWIEDRVDRWRAEKQCEIPEWVDASLERIF